MAAYAVTEECTRRQVWQSSQRRSPAGLDAATADIPVWYAERLLRNIVSTTTSPHHSRQHKRNPTNKLSCHPNVKSAVPQSAVLLNGEDTRARSSASFRVQRTGVL